MTDQPTGLARRDFWVAAALALLVLASGQVRMVPGVCGVYHDDAIYVSTARALAEGKGYCLMHLPGAPTQTKYPILYPALLAVIWKVCPTFPANLIFMQELTLACAAGLVALAYLYAVRFGYAGRGVAVTAGLLCASGSDFLYFATLTLAEMPFGLLWLIALWQLERHVRAQPGRGRQLFLGGILALPFWCRTIGATLVPAALWVLHRAGRPIRWAALGAGLAAVPWVAWAVASAGLWRHDPVAGYYTDYVGWWADASGWALLHVVRVNLMVVLFGPIGLGLEGANQAIRQVGLGQVAVPVQLVLGGIIWGMVACQALRGRPLAAALASYVLLVLVWPWLPGRFLVPIQPVLLMVGLEALARPLRNYRPVLAGLSVVLIGLNVIAFLRVVQTARQTGYPVVTPDQATHWRPYEETFAWLRQHARPDDSIASGLDSMVALYTDRQAFRPFVHRPLVLFYGAAGDGTGPVEELLTILRQRRPRYLVELPMPNFAEEGPFTDNLRALRARHPHYLQEVFRASDPRFVVYEVRPPSGP